MKGQVSFEALIVLAAYLAFLGALVFYAASVEKGLHEKSDAVSAEWSAERVSTLENLFVTNGRNSAWNASVENCTISETVYCTFGKEVASKEAFGGLNATEEWKQPI